jgi:hypothetical protein
MIARFRFALTLSVLIFLASCGQWAPAPTPLPGWRSPVSDLFLDASALPQGWTILHPEYTVTDPTINHVGREWGHPGLSGQVRQSIWRSYTVADAQDKYDELRQTQFAPSRSLYPGMLYVPFEPPVEITFRSQMADKFYLACGWWRWAYCEVVVRYRNYVVELSLDREAEYEGHITQGLSYSEIESVIKAMDTRFVQVLESLPTPVP